MRKTIKIIDLLNKIANGEEVPKKIKYRADIFEYNSATATYRKINSNRTLLQIRYFGNHLSEDAEIIEEESMMTADEMFEKLGYKVEHHIAYIKYIQKIKQNCCDDVKELQIWFYPIDESFEKIGGLITIEELQAINKKVEELGWNE